MQIYAYPKVLMIAGQSSTALAETKLKRNYLVMAAANRQKSAILHLGGNTQNFKQNRLRRVQVVGAALPFEPFISPFRDS
jgi:hypothetical protein